MKKSAEKNNRRYYMLLIIFGIIFSWILGYFSRVVIEKYTMYQLPDNIKVTGVTFNLDEENLTCDFVPEVYSDKLNYEVRVVDRSGNIQKGYKVNIENGEGSVETPVQNAHTYKFILIISNGNETRNITMVDKLFVNLKDNTISIQ